MLSTCRQWNTKATGETYVIDARRLHAERVVLFALTVGWVTIQRKKGLETGYDDLFRVNDEVSNDERRENTESRHSGSGPNRGELRTPGLTSESLSSALSRKLIRYQLM